MNIAGGKPFKVKHQITWRGKKKKVQGQYERQGKTEAWQWQCWSTEDPIVALGNGNVGAPVDAIHNGGDLVSVSVGVR